MTAADRAARPRGTAFARLRAAVGEGSGSLSIGELVDALAERAFGLGLLAFMLPLCLPMPPGIHTIAGAVLLVVAVQLISGRERLWLPDRLRRQQVSRSALHRTITTVQRYLGWIERLSRPRWQHLTGREGSRGVGAVLFVLALIMMLPIPIMGNLPPALAICVLALGLAESDGKVLLGGFVASAVAIAFTSTVAVATARALFHLAG